MKSQIVLVLLGSMCFSQNRATEPSNPVQGTVYVTRDPLSAPNSLGELLGESPLVVVARVGSRLATWREDPQRSTSLITDFVVDVQRSLKGQARGQIVVREGGGQLDGLSVVTLDNPLLVPGERYVLCLIPSLHPAGPATKLPRYLVTGIWSGKLHLTKGKVLVPKASASGLRTHDQEDEASFIAKIEDHVRRTVPR